MLTRCAGVSSSVRQVDFACSLSSLDHKSLSAKLLAVGSHQRPFKEGSRSGGWQTPWLVPLTCPQVCRLTCTTQPPSQAGQGQEVARSVWQEHSCPCTALPPFRDPCLAFVFAHEGGNQSSTLGYTHSPAAWSHDFEFDWPDHFLLSKVPSDATPVAAPLAPP